MNELTDRDTVVRPSPRPTSSWQYCVAFGRCGGPIRAEPPQPTSSLPRASAKPRATTLPYRARLPTVAAPAGCSRRLPCRAPGRAWPAAAPSRRRCPRASPAMRRATRALPLVPAPRRARATPPPAPRRLACTRRPVRAASRAKLSYLICRFVVMP